MQITYEQIRENPAVAAYIDKGNEVLGALGFTEHSKAHAVKVAETAGRILSQLGLDHHRVELVKIAGYMHDMGNSLGGMESYVKLAEEYPDRYKGGVFGCHEETPHVEPHLVPQDCGMHMQTRQAMLEQRDACGHTTAALTLQQVDAPFAFSALPNTAQEIEAAQHITELPATGRTSVMVLGAVRGVGGIDSWGTDVEEPYHVSGEEDHSVSFRIVL